MRPADPAVDAEQVDAVRLTAEHALAYLGEPHGELSEAMLIPWSRGRERLAALRLDEALLPSPELPERREEP